MSWGSKTTTNQTSSTQAQQNNQFSNTSTPNLPDWLQSMFKGLASQGQGLVNAAQQPVFGGAQQANYLSNLNDLANNATKQLSSTLASKGVSNSGAFSQGATDISLNRLGQASSFFANLPFQEQQARLANEGNALGIATNIARSVPYGTTQSGTSSGTSDSNSNSQSTTTQSPGLSGLVGGLLGIGLGGLTGGFGSMLSGGSFGGGFGSAIGGGPNTSLPGYSGAPSGVVYGPNGSYWPGGMNAPWQGPSWAGASNPNG